MENAQLSASLSAALAFRASLLPDVGPEIQQIKWLREHQKQCITRKERLKEQENKKFMYIYVHLQMFIYLNICLFVYLYVYGHIYMYIYIYIC